MKKATVFLVPDVGEPGQRALLNVGLAGGSLMSLQCLVSGFGPRVAYKRALKSRRTVWFSDEFQHAHPTLMNMCVTRLAAEPHQWRIISERERFLERVLALNQHRKTCLGFVGKGEVGDVALQRAKLLTANQAVQFLAVVDRESSSSAMCAK